MSPLRSALFTPVNVHRPFFPYLLVGLLASAICLTPARAVGQQTEQRIQSHLQAGEFGPARQIADSLQDASLRDAWFQRIAEAQAVAGARRAAGATAVYIQDDRMRWQTFKTIQGEGSAPGGRAGGAALADFDTLIELIKSTVAPDSWDDVGGPGAAEPFPGGVYVDPDGVLKRRELAVTGASLDALYDSSTISEDDAQQDVRRDAALRKISLTRLERALQRRVALGEGPSEAMKTLAGLRRIRYLFFYPQTRDIVIAGPAGDWRRNAEGRWVSRRDGAPVVQLEDLVVLLRNSRRSSGRWGCAITPRQDNLKAVRQFLATSAGQSIPAHRRQAWLDELRRTLGFQDITVFGIDPGTRAARTIVEADYHMKLIAMGLEEGTLGVESYLDRIEPGADGTIPELSVLRWWFTLNYEDVTTTEQRNAFEIAGTGVKVLSENELLTDQGRRVHTGKSDVWSQAFARDFTNQFEQLSVKYPVYAELRNLFDLAIVIALMHLEHMPENIQWRMTLFDSDSYFPLPRCRPPETVLSVVHWRDFNRRTFVAGVSGGVTVDAFQYIAAHPPVDDQYGLLKSEYATSVAKDAAPDRWWWD